MVMMMFMSCYTIVDGIFISRYLGSEALSAANIVYPVSIFYWQSESCLRQEEVPLSVKTWGGEKRRGHGGLLVSHCSRSGAQCTFDDRHITFHNQISLFLGSSERILDYCNAYLIYLVLFAPACMLQSLYQSFFVTAGKPRLGLVLTVIAGLANAFLIIFSCGLRYGN